MTEIEQNKFIYLAKLVRVVDGDTIDAMIDLGFNTHVKRRIRLYRINAWESRTRDKEEKKKGLAAKQRLIDLLEANSNEFILKSFGKGKYGRALGEIYVKVGESDICVNDMLVNEGHAEWYDGRKKR